MGLYVLSVVDLHVRLVDVASPMRCDGMMYVLRRGGVSGHKIRNSETRCEKAHSLMESQANCGLFKGSAVGKAYNHSSVPKRGPFPLPLISSHYPKETHT
jgi:hypothetical protein